MKTTITQTGASTLWRAVARLVMVTLALTAVTVLAPSAAQATGAAPATFVGSDGYTYTRLTDKASFVYANQVYGKTLFVDTAHQTADGFYFAQKGTDPSTGRSFTWVYQPFGVRCLIDDVYDVAFNPWMNTYTCMVDPVAADKAKPGYDVQGSTAYCQQNGTKPWAAGILSNNTGTGAILCANHHLLTAEQRWNAAPPEYLTCAPWEPQGLDSSGARLCAKVHYAWESDPAPLPWVAQPDQCTHVPAHANEYTVSYDADAAPVGSPDASCTGAVVAPNCTAAQSGLPACGGATENNIPVGPLPASGGPVDPPTDQTATVTESATADAQTATATKGVSATYRKTVQVRSVVRRHAYGHTFKAVAYSPVTVSVTEFRTRSVTATRNGMERSATASCTAATMDEATTCARAKAHDQALAASAADTLAAATLDAESAAKAAAYEAALTAAKATAHTAKPDITAYNAAKRKATAKAKADVERQIRHWAATH